VLVKVGEAKIPEFLQKITELEEIDKLLSEEYKELQQKQKNPTFADLNNFSKDHGLQQSFETKFAEIREKTLKQLEVLDDRQSEAIKQQETLNEEIKALQEKINQQDKSIAEAEEFREKAHIRLDKLQQEKDSLMKVETIDEPTKSQDWRLLEEEIKIFQSQLGRDKQLVGLQRQLREKENEIGNLGQQNQAFVTKHMEILGIYEKLYQRDLSLIEDYELKIKELMNSSTSKSQAVINERSLAEESKDMAEVPKSFLGIQAQLTLAEEELAQAKIANAEEVSNVKAQLQHEKDELVKAKDEIRIAKQDLEKKREDINHIKEEQETSKKQFDELTRQLKKEKKEKEKVSARVQALEKETKKLGEDISGKLQQISQLKGSEGITSKELIDLKLKLEKLEEEKKAVDNKLIAENTAHKEANQNIQQVKSAADREKEALQQHFQQQLATLEKEKADKVKEVSDNKL